MVITRKIEVFVCEDDKELRREYYQKLWDHRDAAVKIANMTVSHLFALDNTMPYLSDEDRERVTFLGVRGDKATKQNAPYVVASGMYKGQINTGMIVALQQDVRKMYQDDRKHGMWNKSLRSYKQNMPVPWAAKNFRNLRFAKYVNGEGREVEGCFFSVIGVPFQMRFGSDRSGNRLIVERVISGEYKMCTSSLKFDGKKIFLLLCVDIPRQEVKLDAKKTLYAFLGVMNPIVCTCHVNAAREFDSGMKVWEIGTADEFHYRRRQIQEAVKRCQKNNRYSKGGKGRERKCQAIDRWHEKESDYVDTRLHTYSRMLVDMAVRHKCGTIVLMRQKKREEQAKDERQKGDDLVLRNWGYFGLKEKIAYKCKMAGVKLVEDKDGCDDIAADEDGM